MVETIINPARIYCGTYGKYNAGSIAGAWLDLDDYDDADAFYTACRQLHDDEHNLQELQVSADVEALTLTVAVNHDLVDGADYRELLNIYKETADFHAAGFKVLNDGKEEATVKSKEELLAFLMNVAKKGIRVQRYKGLGEMNAEQLWETTMNPETRRLLQVTIEDEVAADEIFSVLMGNQVEPRRDFIQTHAHEVENLDI